MAKAVDGRLFVLAEAACLESRRPFSMATSSRPRACCRLADGLPRAGRHARASPVGRAAAALPLHVGGGADR
ncbi:MAG: hypothetical protein WCP70_05785 [Methanothrix sp.]